MKTLHLIPKKSPAQLLQLKPKPILPYKLLIKSKRTIQFIPLTSISYLKSSSNYCEIFYGGNKKIISSKTLGSYESKLNANFIRIHHGCIVNIGHIAKIDLSENSVIMENGDSLPISRSRRQEFLSTFKNQIR